MKNKSYFVLQILLIIGFVFPTFAYSQASEGDQVSIILKAIDTLNKKLPVEKLYLQLDRPYYSINDTIWFRAYIFQGPFLTWSDQSGILYAELVDGTNTVVQRMKFPVIGGMAWGNISLQSKDLTVGSYTLRAYTKWILNFKGDYVFTKKLFITDVSDNQLKWQIANERSITNTEVDLQFLPEGGKLVAGLSTHVAFKALGQDGRAKEVKGRILNSKKQPILTFESSYKGMGAFDLVPGLGEIYYAELSGNGANIEKFNLPNVQEDGIVLRVQNILSDSLKVIINKNEISTQMYYLIGRSRGVVCYAAAINFKNIKEVVSLVSKAQFPSGVARFTLFNSLYQPLNERAVYIEKKDALNIEFKDEEFSDSVLIDFSVKDAEGNPVESVFSMAVTVDSLISIPSFQSNLLSSILLEADIKGKIEDPAYFLSHTDDSEKALDLLMLTQGWTGYSWEEILQPVTEPKFKPEKEFTISGKSINLLTGKPRSAALIALNTKKPMMFLDTLTESDGSFTFKNIPPSENEAYLLTAKNAKGKDSNVKIMVEGEKALGLEIFKLEKYALATSDTGALKFNTIRNNFFKNTIGYNINGVNALDEVTVVGKRIIKNSKNKNGDGNADITFNEKDLKQVPEMTLLELLQKQVKGFRLIRGPGIYSYAIGNKILKLVFDGTDPFYVEQSPEINFLNDFKAKNVKGIEIMTSIKNVQTYQNWFSPERGAANLSSGSGTSGMLRMGDTAYVEITTYGGGGPTIRQRPGMQVIRVLPFSLPHKFYNPKYLIEKDDSMPDFNPLAFWEPSILTNLNGEAKLSFYHKHKPGNYTVIIEGSDMNGNLGSVRQQFKLKK
ncbi:hypothetical protein [Arcticibacter eurypsychrophilus]|uniref:hypothetical protein n=1 Tax=Arcticibacter eurypsychrophilus TaxID=1434752 RepID=UPI00084E04F9|nr:hypothetical protein [Arcticibacter eurypsychrophilus]